MVSDDDDLRQRLRAADPARSLAPLRADHLHRMTEDAMTSTHDQTSTSSAPRARRRALAWGGGIVGVAAAAALVIPLTLTTAAGTTTVTQPAAGGPAAMCAEITPEAIASFDASFRARVTSIEGDTVTLGVVDRFDGDVQDTVVTTQGDGTPVDGGPLVFEPGGVYLVSVSGGVIVSCGVSGVDSPELDALYRAAFGG